MIFWIPVFTGMTDKNLIKEGVIPAEAGIQILKKLKKLLRSFKINSIIQKLYHKKRPPVGGLL